MLKLEQLTLEQICCLHEAIKERMPLPRNTLISTVQKAFNIKSWRPRRDNGFTTTEEITDDDVGFAYCVQTQRYQSLSQGRLETTGDLGKETKVIQDKYDALVLNQALVEKVIDSLFEVRIDAILSKISHDLSYDLDSMHELVDALLHMNPRQMEYLQSISMHLPVHEFQQGVWILEKLYERFEHLSESEINTFLHAVDQQINPAPKNSLSDTLNKEQEPEYRIDDQASIRTFDALSSLCFNLYDKLLENDQIENWHVEIRVKLLHIGYRLHFSANWTPFDTNTPQLPEVMKLYQDDKIGTTFVRDCIVLSVIKNRAIQEFGMPTIRDYFEQLIKSREHDQALFQSLSFNRDNLTLRGDEQIQALEKHYQSAVSPFLKGLIGYILATKYDHNNPERIDLMISSLEVFAGVDPIRFESVVTNLVSGSTEGYDEYDNPIINVETECYDKSVIRMISIVSYLNSNHVSEFVKVTILDNVREYLSTRISNHRSRTTDSDYPFLYMFVPGKGLETDKDQVLQLKTQLEELIRKNINHSSIVDLLRNISELCLIIQSAVLNQVKLDITDNFLHLTTKNIALDMVAPIEIFSSRYKFDMGPDRLLEFLGSFFIHLSESHIHSTKRKQILEIYSQEISELKEKAKGSFEATIYSFMSDVISDCKLQSPNDWIEIYRKNAVIKMQELIEEGEDRTQNEAILGLVMIGTWGLLPNGFGILKWPHQQFTETTNMLIDSIGDKLRISSEKSEYLELIEQILRVTTDRTSDAIDSLENNPESSRYDFNPDEVIKQLRIGLTRLSALSDDLTFIRG
jgi:hypothetical protein